MPTPPLHVLIAGAGIGGLTAALALAQKGARVDVFEQAPRIETVGAGLQQSANAMHVHKALGIADAVATRGFAPGQVVLRQYQTGKRRLRVPLGLAHTERYGAPYVHIHRADLHDVLCKAAIDAGATIHLNQTVSEFSQTPTDVTLETDKTTVSADVLIGADGVRSKIREGLFPPHTEPRFTGQIAWRGTLAAHDDLREILSPDANVWMGPGRHCVCYYVRGGSMINFVAVEERDNWIDESWSQPGNKDDLLHAFKGWDPALLAILSRCEQPYIWGLFDHAPLPHWVRGRVALLGDAAHPMLPFMAQGAAMAIEDAYVLASSLMMSGAIPTNALTRYQTLRRARATRVQKRSSENADLFHRPNGLRQLWRDTKFAVANAVPAAQHSQFDWLYRYDATQVR